VGTHCSQGGQTKKKQLAFGFVGDWAGPLQDMQRSLIAPYTWPVGGLNFGQSAPVRANIVRPAFSATRISASIAAIPGRCALPSEACTGLHIAENRCASSRRIACLRVSLGIRHQSAGCSFAPMVIAGGPGSSKRRRYPAPDQTRKSHWRGFCESWWGIFDGRGSGAG